MSNGGRRWLPPSDSAPPGAGPSEASPYPGEAPPDAVTEALAPAATSAPWSARAQAAVVDLFVRLGIALACATLGLVGYASGTEAGNTTVSLGLVIGGLLGGIVYAPYMIATHGGQTIGHRVSRTRIVRSDGSRLTGAQGFVREVLVKSLLIEGIGGLVLLVPLILNYLWPLWDERNEALHDKLCSTRVVEA